MTKKLYNISDEIDESRRKILLLVTQVAQENNCKFIIIGATARDIILKYCYQIKEDFRATVDLDIGIVVPNWKVFEEIRNSLVEIESFTTSSLEYRIFFEDVIPIDLLPFGGITTDEGKIYFPPEYKEMTILGFEEALENAKEVIIEEEKPKILVADLQNLFVMKLISWNEKYPDRRKDAMDMYLIIKYYLEGDNKEKLYGQYSDILQEDGFDYELASARILGRDIAKTLMKNTLNSIEKILTKEINPDNEFRLINDFSSMIFADNPSEMALSYLENIHRGIIES